MKGMILAAGRGTRMAHLTRNTAKPLLRVGDKALIEYRVEAFVAMGITDIIINVFYCADQIEHLLGDGSRYGASIYYSREVEPLEVGGGIYHALPLLGTASFMAMNADLWTDFMPKTFSMPQGSLAHLILVPNPSHHPKGDFSLADGLVARSNHHRLTFSGIGFYHPDFFQECSLGSFPLCDVLLEQIPKGVVTGECYRGEWHDVGTPERLAHANAQLLGV